MHFRIRRCMAKQRPRYRGRPDVRSKQNRVPQRRRAHPAWLLVLAPLMITGCALRPNPITTEEHAERAQQDFDQLTKRYVPVTGPLTLAEAIARALKYNYDAELARVEQTLQEQQL